MNVFDCAMKIEEETRSFYQKMERKSSSSELRTLFSILAAAEKEHLEALVELKRRADEGDGELRQLEPEACRFKAVSDDSDLTGVLKSDQDFYLHAVREEEQDIKFYEDLASRTQDEKLRQKLLLIAEQERRHLEKIENIYDFVEAPRTYLAWGEFGNLSQL